MNPYEILGVSENATDDEIKKAYRQLVKKFHPDRYAHDSAQQAVASEKLKQINAAYDMITKIRQGNYNWSNSPEFASIRSAIQRGDLNGAEEMLQRMTEHPAEWHYLMGIVMMRKGWYDGASEHFTQAYNMEPSNQEYEQAMRSMSQTAGGYMDFGGGSGVNMSSPLCKICCTCGCLGCLASNFFCRPWMCCC
ncbi:MAG: J domain-containing protein [Christensenellaceae bacterium]